MRTLQNLSFLPLIFFTLLFTSLFADNHNSQWGIRFKATKLVFDDIKANFQANNDPIDISVTSEYLPEIDITYNFNKNFALELPVALAKLNPVADGIANTGSVSFLPLSIFAQYHFTNDSIFKPYIGAGAGYAIYTNRSKSGSYFDNVTYDNDYLYAAQLGLDVKINEDLSVGIDFRQLFLDTVITVKDSNNAAKIDAELDPMTISANVAMKF